MTAVLGLGRWHRPHVAPRRRAPCLRQRNGRRGGRGKPKCRIQPARRRNGRHAPSPTPGPCTRRARCSGSILSPRSTAGRTTAQRSTDGAVQTYSKLAFARRSISWNHSLTLVWGRPLHARGRVIGPGYRSRHEPSALDSATSRRLPCTPWDCPRGRMRAGRASTRPHTRLTGGRHYRTY